MPDHPEWALKFKSKNTELRCRKGRYFLYNITSVWDPSKGRTKKVTLGYVGTITEEHGLIPKGMVRRGPVPKGMSRLKDIPSDNSDFTDTFQQLDDPRALRNRLHPIQEILFVTLCAVLCGADGWQDVEDFGKSKLPFLRQYFDFENGVPSDDTVRRFFRALDPTQFERLFRDWVSRIAQTVDAQVIAIDGKCSRHSFDKNTNMLHMVSAFATEARIVLGQEKVDNKTNEINAIPKLLEWLDVKGHIVTIDAMGCQHAIAEQIVKKEGDYIFALKGNQERLSQDVALYFEDPSLPKPESHIEYDKGHGRYETRECWVVTDVEWLREMHSPWQTIQSIIKLTSVREIDGKSTQETRYYVSSLKEGAQKILRSIRSHWAIENTLHWVLDMSFNEDASRIRKQNAPHIMAILRHVALNLLQRAKKERQSIKGLRKICGWDDLTLQSVLSQKSS